tara:strand:- start:646 stop:1077 length:432 start_codon:yes stop_codon:yes gene_type:complete
VAFKLTGFPTHQTATTIGGVSNTPLKHGNQGPPDHPEGEEWASHYATDDHGPATGGEDSDSETGFNDPDPSDATGDIDFGVSAGTGGIVPRISGEGAGMIAEWGKKKWAGMGTGGRILSVIGGVAAPIAAVAGYARWKENQEE